MPKGITLGWLKWSSIGLGCKIAIINIVIVAAAVVIASLIRLISKLERDWRYEIRLPAIVREEGSWIQRGLTWTLKENISQWWTNRSTTRHDWADIQGHKRNFWLLIQ